MCDTSDSGYDWSLTGVTHGHGAAVHCCRGARTGVPEDAHDFAPISQLHHQQLVQLLHQGSPYTQNTRSGCTPTRQLVTQASKHSRAASRFNISSATQAASSPTCTTAMQPVLCFTENHTAVRGQGLERIRAWRWHLVHCGGTSTHMRWPTLVACAAVHARACASARRRPQATHCP